MIEPLIVEFEVEAPIEHAFAVWVDRPTMWWPRAKTVSRDALDAIVFEGAVGGRVYERSVDGVEHDWGRITRWDPPNGLSYTWHLFFDPAEATDVDVRFEAAGDVTHVTIEQVGWERLGVEGETRRTNTDRAWSIIVPVYTSAVDAS